MTPLCGTLETGLATPCLFFSISFSFFPTLGQKPSFLHFRKFVCCFWISYRLLPLRFLLTFEWNYSPKQWHIHTLCTKSCTKFITFTKWSVVLFSPIPKLFGEFKVCVCVCWSRKYSLIFVGILNGLYDLKRWDMGKSLNEQWVEPVLLSLLDWALTVF